MKEDAQRGDAQTGAGGDILAWTTAAGAAFVPFAPLGRGFLTGALRSRAALQEDGFRRRIPRFEEEALAANAAIGDTVVEVARGLGRTPSQVALAWVLQQGELETMAAPLGSRY